MADIKIVTDEFGVIPDPANPKDASLAQRVLRVTLSNKSGTQVQIINYGATITSLKVADRNGKLDDIVLGFEDINGYLGAYGRNPYFGATIGRTSNRTGKGKFTLNGKQYQLGVNNGENSLHGGNVGFDKKIWDMNVSGKTVVFSCTSKDGEEGYPGNLLANVTFELTPDDRLIIDFKAVTTQPTPVALTNHSYFNLSGHKNADKKLQGHHIMLNADNYTPVNDSLIPTGEIKAVEGTIFDLRTTKKISDILSKNFDLSGPNGYDNNFCVNKSEGETVRLVARAQDTATGRALEVFSDQPGVQFYTANFLPDKDPLPGKEGAKYWKHGAFCLETQNYPDSVNHANFPNPILNPGSVYTHKVIYKLFTTAT